ncbi:DUF1656 domain-containing protein [Burkholderia cenocepacia]|uniref:DUF1656 domain-containing protein n=1 Tax=Burkholderia cenocepacia TaxID=95486 RepID=UPI00196A8464|nr:DUF1656 domain-containing protein [Burkholderia cenocepacia]MBN3534286.1 DUF1656 domain-containing protein [Burkholderia cenocepacia]MBR8030277.1 DUF1656 domain-containing protein [Burkholderia cenocepacia]MBR8174091.1 DUF1656 domain-containing protein [Burkholderia cenocepacia]MBR8428792.1 DUF1656 domain-containing protein [Burkholderia cenocepacia]MBU9660047.1 DUF1656 domain-containing protein [Burkholderia cenocepacia]
MNTDIDIFGVFVPPMVFVASIAFVIWLLMKRSIALLGLYRFVALRNLVDISMYFVILAGMLVLFGGTTIEPLFQWSGR